MCRLAPLAAILMLACTGISYAEDDHDLLKQPQGIFQPLPKDMGTAEFPATAERVALGRKLFFDPENRKKVTDIFNGNRKKVTDIFNGI